MTLIARGGQSDILVATITALRGADVILVADDDILDTDLTDNHLVTADDLRLTANNAADDQTDSIRLSTNVNDLQARRRRQGSGRHPGLRTDSINLASSDQQGDEIVETSNGQIVITARDKITIFDTSLNDDGDNLASRSRTRRPRRRGTHRTGRLE